MSNNNLLQNSNSKARRFRFRGNRDLQAQLAELTQAAAIIRAVYFRPIRGATPLEQNEDIKNSIRQAEGFGRFEIGKEGDQTQLQRVIAEIEKGYRDTQNPYGGSFADRPKITIIEQEQNP